MGERRPYTMAELDALLHRLDASLRQTEEASPGLKGLPPLFRTECVDRLNALADLAMTRPLSREEAFLHGQLCASLVQAVRAEMLGQKGKRYYVVSEEDLQRLLAGQEETHGPQT